MAYGSVTLPVRTKTVTSFEHATESTSALASTSHTSSVDYSTLHRRTQSDLVKPKDDSDLDFDSDPDFGYAATARLQKEVEEDPKARERKGKGKEVSKKVKLNRDESAKPIHRRTKRTNPSIVAAKQRFHVPQDSSSSSYDDSDREERSHKSYKRKGKLAVSTTAESPADVVRHLKGKWRSREQREDYPERMSRTRKRLEEKYNPLIKLLKIKIDVCDSDEERGVAIEHIEPEEVATDVSSSDQQRRPKLKWRAVSEDEERWLGFDVAATQLKMQEDDLTHRETKGEPKCGEECKPSTCTPTMTEVDEPIELDSDPPTEDEIDVISLDVKAEVGGVIAGRVDSSEEEDELSVRLKEEAENLLKKKLAKELALRLASNLASNRQDVGNRASEQAPMDVDEEDDEDMQEMDVDQACSTQVYPLKSRKGRPHFEIKTREQHLIGAHKVAEGFEIPSSINRHLRPYQRDGVDFLFAQYAKSMGGLLGDDMGLGKTIQVIAFLSTIMRKAPAMGLHGVTGRKSDRDARKHATMAYQQTSHDEEDPLPSDFGVTCLIVCPASVVHNWAREFKTWSHLSVAVYEGKNRNDVLKPFRNGHYDVVIAGIETVRINVERLRSEDFTIVIVDEAHRLKNPLSETTKALHCFPTKLRYGLTGTAIQNRLQEFWCLLNWVAPLQVGTKNNWDLYVSRPLKYAQKSDATSVQLAKGRSRALSLVTNLLPHFWLRRTKDQVKLQLPQKRDNIVICPLTPLQTRAYKRILALEDIQIILRYDEVCPCGRKDNELRPYPRNKCCFQDWYKLILKYITLLQKIANHLALIYPDNEDYASNREKYDQDVQWVRAAFPEDHLHRKRGAITSLDPDLCGKWTILEKLLALWHSQGDKILIFSLSLRVLSLVKEKMEQTHYRFVSLDGSVPNDQRMDLVDEFNNNPDVFAFLISTRAGGVGLNLTAANRVVIFDPNWNPSHDLQAMDRAYRFGQMRDVEVYRLVGAGTLEELIYNRQQYKRAQAGLGYEATAERRMYSGVEGVKEDFGELFGVRNIFKFNEHSSLTEMSMKACDMAELEFALRNASIDEEALSKKKSKRMKQRKGNDEEDNEDAFQESDEEEEGLLLKRLITQTEVKPASVASDDDIRRKKAQGERDAITNIFSTSGVTVNVVSDAMLGGSRAEEALARRAIAEVEAKKTQASKGPAEGIPTLKNRAAPASDEGTDAAWDPLARGKKSKPATHASPPLEQPSASSRITSIAARLDIDPNVPVSDLLAASGYEGDTGIRELTLELAKLDSAEYIRRIKQILRTYQSSTH